MKAGRFWRAIVWLWGINFFAFWLVALLIGGDAVNGHREGERHLLFNRGRLTEVSPEVWWYSRVHVISVVVLLPFAMAASVALDIGRRRHARFPPGEPFPAEALPGAHAWTCRHVHERTQPILRVAHRGESWSFLCDRAHPSAGDWVKVGAEHLLRMDRSVPSILDLRDGREAVRPRVGGPWTRRRLPRT